MRGVEERLHSAVPCISSDYQLPPELATELTAYGEDIVQVYI